MDESPLQKGRDCRNGEAAKSNLSRPSPTGGRLASCEERQAAAPSRLLLATISHWQRLNIAPSIDINCSVFGCSGPVPASVAQMSAPL
jgi:hypothetical protein